MIRIDKNISVNDIEKYYDLVHSESNIGDILSLDLSVSTSIQSKSSYGPGIMISLMQFFITWSRVNNCNGKISTVSNTEKYISFFEDNVLENPELLCLLAMNKFNVLLDDKLNKSIKLNKDELFKKYSELESIIKTVKNYNKYLKYRNHVLSSELSKQKDILEQSIISYNRIIQKYKKNLIESDSPSLYFGCFDRELQYEFPSYFYTDRKFNTNIHDEFVGFIKEFLSLTKVNKKTELIKNAFYKDIATVLYELIENTEKWAKRRSDSSSQLSPNIRGAYLCLNFIKNETISNPPNALNDFIDRFKMEAFDNKRVNDLYLFEDNVSDKEISQGIGILEISVIDSGPGFVKRHLNGIDVSSLSFEEEVMYFEKCFQRHFTSDTSSVGEGRGMGLSSVINAIKNKGFIKIRTGRVFAYRNFFEDPITADELVQNRLTFWDWETQGNTLTCVSKVEGTSITILYPFAL